MPEGSGSFRGIAIRQPVNIVVAAEVSPLIGETGFRRKGLRVAEGYTRSYWQPLPNSDDKSIAKKRDPQKWASFRDGSGLSSGQIV